VPEELTYKDEAAAGYDRATCNGAQSFASELFSAGSGIPTKATIRKLVEHEQRLIAGALVNGRSRRSAAAFDCAPD